MIRGRNIISLASNWHFDPTSKHHVMSILSRHNHVLWVNYHGSRRPQASAADLASMARKVAAVSTGAQWVSDTLQVITPLLLPLPGCGWARRINQKVVVAQIRKALTRFPEQAVQLWSFAPDAAYLVGQFGEELDVYYCVDEFSAFSDYDAATINTLERELIESCDVVLTTARHLQQSKSALHPRTHLVTHGVSFEHFARATAEDTEVPENIRDIAGPIFGFFGIIQDWVDLELVAELAGRRPDWSFVLIGKVAAPNKVCRGQDNIHFLGQVPYETLPGYCKAFDVGLIPFKINRLTMNVNPIKLREYLAAGLPVVATDLQEVRQYQPHVLIGSDSQGFERACEDALQRRSVYHRRLHQNAVRNETWAHKVEHISQLVGTLLPSATADPPANPACHTPGTSTRTADLDDVHAQRPS